MFLDDIVHDSGPFPPAFGAGLNEDCRHDFSPRSLSIEASIAQSQGLQQRRTACRRAQRPAWRALCSGASNVSACAATTNVFCRAAAQRWNNARPDDRVTLELGGQSLQEGVPLQGMDQRVRREDDIDPARMAYGPTRRRSGLSTARTGLAFSNHEEP